MNIPDKAVEAAAKAYRAKVEWIDRHSRDDYGREDELGMRAALEAAAPHMLAGARADLVNLAKEFDGAEGGTLAYTTILDGRHAMRKNAHDQLMYILDSHLPNHAGANHDH